MSEKMEHGSGLRISSDLDHQGLMEFGAMIWKQRNMVIALTMATVVISSVVSLMLTPTYRADVLLAPVAGEENKSGMGAFGGLAGLAGLAGLSTSADSAEENLAILRSREFLWQFVKDENLMPILFEGAAAGESSSAKWRAYRAFSKLMTVKQDRITKLVTISVEWADGELAAQWVNDLVARLNEHLRHQAILRSEANLGYLNKELAKTSVADMRRTLFELIVHEQKKAMLANTQEEYAFRVLDAAVPPDRKFKPKRTIIVVSSTLIAVLVAMMLAILREQFLGRKMHIATSREG